MKAEPDRVATFHVLEDNGRGSTSHFEVTIVVSDKLRAGLQKGTREAWSYAVTHTRELIRKSLGDGPA